MKSKQLVVLLAIFAIVVIPCLAWAQDGNDNGKPEKKVTIDFRDVPIQSAVRILFEGTGFSYNFEPGVTGNVNMKLVDVAFSQALDKVLQSANMTLRNENNVFTIGPKKDQVTEITPTPVVSIEETQLTPKMIVEKIPIGNLSLYDMLSMLYGQGMMGGQSSGGGQSGGMGSSSNRGNSSNIGSSGSNNTSSNSSSFGSSGSSSSSSRGSSSSVR